MTGFDNRPKAHYRKDISGSVGEVMGPTLNGREFLVVDDVEFDGERSTAYFRNATAADFPIPEGLVPA